MAVDQHGEVAPGSVDAGGGDGGRALREIVDRLERESGSGSLEQWLVRKVEGGRRFHVGLFQRIPSYNLKTEPATAEIALSLACPCFSGEVVRLAAPIQDRAAIPYEKDRVPSGPMPRPKNLPTFVTTDDLMKVTGLSRTAMYAWADAGLLPAPEVISDGSRGIKARWPVGALERARFVMAKKAELLSLAEIGKLVEERWGPPTAEDIARREAARELKRKKTRDGSEA